MELDVFKPEGGILLDLMSFFMAGGAESSSLKGWVFGQSDVEGCLSLSEPKVATSNLPLSYHRVPVLCLLKAFARHTIHRRTL